MQIRAKLTLQFILVVTLIIVFAFFVIYYSSSNYRSNEFYTRLEQKARTTAEILLSDPDIDSTTFRRFERSQKDKLPRENIVIYDNHNALIYTNNDSVNFAVNAENIEQTKRRGRIELAEERFQIIGISHQTNGEEYVVFAAAIDKYGYSKLNNLRVTMLLLFFLTISMVAFTGWIYAGKALNPLSNVIDEVEKINVARLDTRLNKSKNEDEIGRLIATFNFLLERVERSVKLQKLFVSGASHELKNPLTSITSQLQVVLLNERSNEEYKTIIESILEDIRKLNRTTLDLIEYARLNYEENIQLQPVRIDDVLWNCRDLFLKHNESCKVHISFEKMPDDEKKLIIRGNEALLKVAFINLIDNACKFSGDSACFVGFNVSAEKVVISFRDNGIGLSEEEKRLIFEPFYRANNTAEIKGHGIGLALTMKIIQLHHAQLSVESEKGKGATFSLSFNL